jgi:hypothetical protein
MSPRKAAKPDQEEPSFLDLLLISIDEEITRLRDFEDLPKVPWWNIRMVWWKDGAIDTRSAAAWRLEHLRTLVVGELSKNRQPRRQNDAPRTDQQ